MNSKTKSNFIFGLSIGLIATLLTWLIIGENSPFADYFLWNPDVRNIWRILHFPVYLIVMFSKPPVYLEPAVTLFSVFVQWTITGLFLKSVFDGLAKLIKGNAPVS